MREEVYLPWLEMELEDEQDMAALCLALLTDMVKLAFETSR